MKKRKGRNIRIVTEDLGGVELQERIMTKPT